ncbi:MAG: 50S ribosomal protein L2 [Planctomycetota bacterium]|jgi:large subunit ribosomal protein L2|nr:50S ribosomal protein L2 [Gemmataceae bacterium]NBS89036.1 50S ribosomal protein L2 [bacterium]NBT62435.1 50S ribosomal protein L2 [Planctomycetia bacterium]PHX62687.1 MAG: 50S ribosomal protein L2 [Planctomycetaceae bacterium]RLS60754.1 MAG: 50S ribosomal protein L2 [Planctomycetota bacterium]
MAIRQYKPVTPGRRQGSVSDFAEITDRKRKPEKSLLLPKKKTGGRNNQGVTCTRFRGGGHKQKYRIIDFKRNHDGIVATVISIEYDPNRSSRIALLEYQDGEKTYILAPEGLAAGDKVMSGEDVEPKIGNCMPLKKIPLGLIVHNVELQPGHGGQVCRSAGTKATLTAREGKWAQITLPSGEVRRVSNECRATIGMIGNTDHMNVSLGKAGRSRWMGRRPHNRGTSMNPVDHPMGGGEGRTGGGRNPCGPTGVLAKGGKTRQKRKPSNSSIVRRRRPGPRNAGS